MIEVFLSDRIDWSAHPHLKRGSTWSEAGWACPPSGRRTVVTRPACDNLAVAFPRMRDPEVVHGHDRVSRSESARQHLPRFREEVRLDLESASKDHPQGRSRGSPCDMLGLGDFAVAVGPGPIVHRVIDALPSFCSTSPGRPTSATRSRRPSGRSAACSSSRT